MDSEKPRCYSCPCESCERFDEPLARDARVMDSEKPRCYPRPCENCVLNVYKCVYEIGHSPSGMVNISPVKE